MIEHACAITAIANPLINSYKRLVSGFEAPVYITWSGPNRSSLIRIPAGRGLSTRVEFRSPDPTCNPYLTFAVILAAGLDGIKRGIDPGEPVDLNVYHLSPAERKALGIKTLPANLKEALDYLEADKVIREALGEHVYENIMRLGLLEWEAYNTYVHPWEIERYINHFKGHCAYDVSIFLAPCIVTLKQRRAYNCHPKRIYLASSLEGPGR